MGCISSKAITRSMSIREELGHGFQSRSAVWEELLSSHSGNDQLFAFVCSSHINATKLKTSSFTLPTADFEASPAAKYLVDEWDMIPDINAEAEVETAPHERSFARSRSCHTMREKEVLNGMDLNDKNVGGSRSFHTVEEYDALLERIHGTRTRTRSLASLENVKLQRSSEDENERRIERGEDDDLNVESREVGWKRKAVARGLKSLDMPTQELPAIARLKQRMLVQGQIDSPGTYVTPKFGSYNAPAAQETETNRQQTTVFSPELVAAFEDCMQQLQVEQDCILRHMHVANT